LAGIFVDRSGSQTIHGNTVFNNGQQGINIAGGVGGNVITANMIDDNGNLVHITSSGIAVRAADNNRLEGNIVSGSRRGIRLSASNVKNSTDNRIEGNTVTGNPFLDMEDTNANCDNNKWIGNTFNTSNQACIN